MEIIINKAKKLNRYIDWDLHIIYYEEMYTMIIRGVRISCSVRWMLNACQSANTAYPIVYSIFREDMSLI